MNHVRRLAAAAALACLSLASNATFAATIRIADWNMGNKPNGLADDASLQTVFAYVAQSRAIDVMAVVETDTLSGPETAGVFRENYTSVMTAADGITHPSLRGQFRPSGTAGPDDFYLYAVHLQSGPTTAIKSTRVTQAQVIRADADALGSTNVIISDFNWQKADDVSADVGAFRAFNALDNGQVSDPMNAIGD